MSAQTVEDVTAPVASGSAQEAVPEWAPVWVPWCPQCRVRPLRGPWPQGGAEWLARQHDIAEHDGAWTTLVLPAAVVARLAAAPVAWRCANCGRVYCVCPRRGGSR